MLKSSRTVCVCVCVCVCVLPVIIAIKIINRPAFLLVYFVISDKLSFQITCNMVAPRTPAVWVT